jgi:hypothetical protein
MNNHHLEEMTKTRQVPFYIRDNGLGFGVFSAVGFVVV